MIVLDIDNPQNTFDCPFLEEDSNSELYCYFDPRADARCVGLYNKGCHIIRLKLEKAGKMTDTELKRQETICEVAGVNNIGELSDGFHTFDSLYEQRMILFAALVKAYKDKAWKSYRHEDGEYCFGGGWFIVGIDTPEGSYTYHYEDKYWDMFDCADLPRAKHWDGHTEVDAETRLMSLEPENDWVPVTKKAHPDLPIRVQVQMDNGWIITAYYQDGEWLSVPDFGEPIQDKWIEAWRELPEPYAERREE